MHKPSPVRHVRTTIPAALHDRVSHLAVDLHRTLGDLVAEGLTLLCQHYASRSRVPSTENEPPTDEES